MSRRLTGVAALFEPPPPARTTYPFHLRPDVVAELRLPDDLTAAEAERIAAFVRTLAIPAKATP